MIPIVTPEEMAAIDAAAPEPVEVLIERAGSAVAWAARRMMGGTYARRVHLIAGKGNNGNDGRVAARRLTQWGVRVWCHDAARLPAALAGADLVIDAAYGTGFRGTWDAPDVGVTPVLAVDIPSGVDGLTGVVNGSALAARRTVTFAALKPGLVLAPGRWLAGDVDVADIGLDVGASRTHLVTGEDVARWWPKRPPDAHKWRGAVRIVAGSPGMTGAAHLAATAAQRAGAGMVTLSIPGHDGVAGPVEAVQRAVPRSGWAESVLADIERDHAAVVGPGLGREEATVAAVRSFAAECPLPLVLDGDALFAVAWSEAGGAGWLRRRSAATVLTPHDGEFGLLAGARPGADRLLAARRLAADTRSVVVLKGPSTVIADPAGDVRVVTVGDERLATAGTGDVLAGMIGAVLAGGQAVFDAAAAAAWVHGASAARGPAHGLVAGDVVAELPTLLDELLAQTRSEDASLRSSQPVAPRSGGEPDRAQIVGEDRP